MKQILALFMIAISILVPSHVFSQKLKRHEVTYKSADGTVCKSYYSLDKAKKGKRTVILVIPEWWGNNAYARQRADMLAEMGYLAMAVDIYGEGKQGNDPATASALAGPFYENPTKAVERMQAALTFLAKVKEANTRDVVAIGYCFGGSMVLNAVGLGLEMKGAVSFHGGLGGLVAPQRGNSTAVLVCHGGDDKFISQADETTFKQNMDASEINYKFITYPDATHAFTNPDATANGEKFGIPIRYNEAADKKSWEDFKNFLGSLKK